MIPIPIAAIGLFWFFAIIVIVLGVGVIALGLSTRGDNSTILEWDPIARTEFKGAIEDDDMEEMLALHNRRREVQGKEPISLNDYMSQVRRREG